MTTFGIVTAVDADGVYVTMPGATNVVRGPFESVQNVAAGDRVLLVTTDEGDPVVVGKSGSSPRSLPATSTDNAVARFDGTGGAVQNSGVTIDDSNRMVLPGSHPGLKVGATGHGTVQVIGEAGYYSSVQFYTGTSTRWTLRRGSGSESGSNAGSDLEILRYSDAGSQVSIPVTVSRATGRITVGDVGTTAGIELGASGPTITTGTGAPSHSAPNGSIYLRTDGTASTTLYVRAGGAWSALS
jgi:hypothetical protein